MTQNELVLDYMKRHGSITQAEAARELGCMRLGARIWDLIHKYGYNIISETVTEKNRYGKPVSFARYRLAA